MSPVNLTSLTEDRIHERLGEINLKETNIKEPTKPTKETGTNNRAEVTNQTNQDTYAKKAQGKKDEIKDAEKEDIKEPIKVLIVATSLTNHLDRRVCEKKTGMQIDIATAYTVDADSDARYKEKIFKKIVPDKLKYMKYDTLVLQSGGIEVTNLDTKEETKEESLQSWKKKCQTSSIKMFNLAEESIKANQGLHVIIVERIPRSVF